MPAPRSSHGSSRWLVGVLVLAALYWTFDLAIVRAGVPHPLDDTWEDGLVARSLLEGHGFRSTMIYPPLWRLRDAHDTVPVLVHGPVLPLALAVPLGLGGPAALDRAAWLAALFAFLTLVPLFRLGARRFGEPVAAAACGLFTFSPLTTAAVNHYGSVVLGALLVTWALELVARERPRIGLGGLVAGFAYLVRPEMLLAAPILAWFAARQAHRARAVWSFTLAFAVAASWWWLIRWRAVGSPFFNLSSYLLVSFSPAHPGDGLFRDFDATPERFSTLLGQALPELWHKWAHFFPRAIKRALVTPSGATGWLAPVGLLAALVQRPSRRFATVALLLALIPLVAITLLVSVRLYTVPVLLLYALGAALGAQWAFEWLPNWAHRPRAWIGALAMVALPSAGLELRADEHEARLCERWLAHDRASLASFSVAPGAPARVMFSDTPDFVAWTTRRPTIWVMRDELARIYGVDSSGVRVRPLGADAARTMVALPPPPAARDSFFHADPRSAEANAP